MLKNKKAFTLAEALVVLAFLGVVVALTIPTAVKNAVTKSNRAKLQRASSVYQRAIESMIVENDLPRSEDYINNWAQNNDCSEIRSYFRVNSSQSGCKFYSVNEIWWNFDPNDGFSLTNALVAFEESKFNDIVAESNEYTAFIMSTSISSDGGLHINDVSYEQDNPSPKYWHAKKIACFVNNESCNAEDYVVEEE